MIVNALFPQNGVPLESIWILIQVSVNHVDMASISPMKVRSLVKFVDWGKQLELPKQHQSQSAVTNASPECNWELMANVKRVHVERSEHRVCNRLVQLVQQEEPHPNQDPPASKSALCLFALLVLISTELLMYAWSAVKDSINQSSSKHSAYLVHRIIVQELMLR